MAYQLDVANADFEIRRDLYRLAQMGEHVSAGQWLAYEASNPSMARIIRKSCKLQDKREAAANRSASQFIGKAAKRIGQKRKKKRTPAYVAKSAPWAAVDPEAQLVYDEALRMRGRVPDFGDLQVAAYRIALARQMVRDELASPDPLRREIAWGQT